MNPQVILWIILAATTLLNALALTFSSVNREIMKELKAAKRAKFGCTQIVLILLLPWVSSVGWLLYSISTGNWLFVIIATVPIAFDLIEKISRNTDKPNVITKLSDKVPENKRPW